MDGSPSPPGGHRPLVECWRLAFLVSLLLLLLGLGAGCGGATSDNDGDRDSRSETQAESEPDPTGEAVAGASAEPELEPEPDPDELWDNREGEDWDAFHEGFSEGWADGCANTMSYYGDGEALYWGRDAVDLYDCENAETDSDPLLFRPSDPHGEGYEEGELAACLAVFDELAYYAGSPNGTLYYDGVGWTSLDCPASIPAGASATPKPMDLVLDCQDFSVEGIIGGTGAGFYDVSVRNLDCESARLLLVANAGQGGFDGRTLRGTDLACVRLSADGETGDYRCSSHRTPEQAIRFGYGA